MAFTVSLTTPTIILRTSAGKSGHAFTTSAKSGSIGLELFAAWQGDIIRHMNPETLAAELNREPFIPLRLRLSNGRTVDIHNPGLCFIARLSLYVFAAKPHESLAEDVQVISLRHIASVETLNPQEAS